jgi:uncharacterized protein
MSLAEIRLTPQEKIGIREALEEASGKAGVVWKRVSLFGSRVNPSLRGGDIDLYVEISLPPDKDTRAFARTFRIALQDRLGERKIDLVIDDGVRDLGAFGEIIRQSKVDLWTKS